MITHCYTLKKYQCPNPRMGGFRYPLSFLERYGVDLLVYRSGIVCQAVDEKG